MMRTAAVMAMSMVVMMMMVLKKSLKPVLMAKKQRSRDLMV